MADIIASKAALRAVPPKSVSSGWTVGGTLIGASIGCAIVFWLRPDLDSRLSALLLMASVFVPGAMVEMFVNMSPETSGLDFTWRRLSLSRIARKITALWAIFAALAIAYAALPVYTADLYRPYQWLIVNFGPALIITSIPYVAAVDTFQTEPEDTLWSLGNQLWSLSFAPSGKEINYLLGWIVKGFFLPLMFCWLIGNVEALRQADYSQFNSPAAYFYEVSNTALYFVDLMVGAVGYASTLRLLGTEIRSVEPTLKGWLVAVVCYDPFWLTVSGSYLAYNHDRPWGALFGDWPVVYAIWGGLILLLVFVYVWATVVFGIRFSNLTHRGIITSGPYRWTKHPAYISKNLSWWLVSIPFLPPDGSVLTALKLSAMLAGVNVIYYLRAKTEERHLMSDPVYREYCEFIRQHGLFSYFRR